MAKVPQGFEALLGIPELHLQGPQRLEGRILPGQLLQPAEAVRRGTGVLRESGQLAQAAAASSVTAADLLFLPEGPEPLPGVGKVGLQLGQPDPGDVVFNFLLESC